MADVVRMAIETNASPGYIKNRGGDEQMRACVEKDDLIRLEISADRVLRFTFLSDCSSSPPWQELPRIGDY